MLAKFIYFNYILVIWLLEMKLGSPPPMIS